MKRLLTVSEFAQTFSLKNMSKIYRHIKTGKLDTSIVGRKRFIIINMQTLAFVEKYYQNGNGNATESKYDDDRQAIINKYRREINDDAGAFRF